MKDLTISRPNWYDEKIKEYNDIIKKGIHRENFNIIIYSKIVHKVIVDAYNWGSDNEIYGIYDLDNNTFEQIGTGMPLYQVSGGANHMSKIYDCSFAYFKLPTGHCNSYGEYDEYDKLVIDSRMNNAPNLSGKDNFNNSFKTICDIVHDFLYFEHKGVRYLINGDYKVLAKFPKKLDIYKSNYVRDNTKQFILKTDKGWCLYDIDENKIIFNDIISVSKTSNCDFQLKNGDIYIYDKNVGKFVLLSKHDNFRDNLEFVSEFVYNEFYDSNIQDENNRDVIRVFKDKNNKFFIIHNNKVINKNCPFDEVKLKKERFKSDTRFLCKVDDIWDIYDGYDKFRFNTININGDGNDKLWFDKD